MRHLVPMRVKADYQSSLRDKYADNPFVASMPPFMEKEDFDAFMSYKHTLPDDLFELLTIDAKEEIDDLKKTYLPLNQSYQLYEHIYVQMRKYYGQVNPLSADARRLQNELSISLKSGVAFRQNEAELYSELCPTILVSGEAGCGKTVTIRKILSLFPQVIQHQSFAGKPFNNEQVVYLSFDMQSSKSKKALAYNFFAELDRVLGLEVSKDLIKGITVVDKLLSAMQLAIHKYSIGIIHIDEFQFALNRRKASKDIPTLAELEALFNNVGVPIILSATQDAITEFSQNAASAESQTTAMQSVRRVSSVAHITFKQWKHGANATNTFFDVYFPKSIFCASHEIDHKFQIQFLMYVAGVPHAMTELAIAFVRNFYDLKKKGQVETISDMSLFLAQVYKVRMQTWHSALRVLQNKYSVSGDTCQSETEKKQTEHVQSVLKATKRKSRTNKPANVVANKIERIEEGEEVINPDSIVADYSKGDFDVL
jgi:myosin heavy subunit